MPGGNHLYSEIPWSVSRETLARLSLLVGASVFASMFFFLSLSSIGLALGYSLNKLPFFLGILLTVVFVAWGTCGHFSRRRALLTTLVSLCWGLLFCTAAYVSGRFYDVTYDGQLYHLEKVVSLCEGWNPYHNRAPREAAGNADFYHFAQGCETISACICRVTGNAEHAKTPNLMLMAGTFCLSFAALLQMSRLTGVLAMVLSSLVALNPVCIYQSLSTYVDGQLSSILASMFAAGFLLARTDYRMPICLWGMLLVLLINAKFTGVVYGAVAAGLLLIALLVWRRPRLAMRYAALSAAAFAYGVCFIGYPIYVRNTLVHGHPFHPLFGPQAVDTITSQSPLNFQWLNRFEKLFLSVFSRTEDACMAGTVQTSSLKNPFVVSRSELEGVYLASDVRIGGWGPLFGAAMTLAAVIVVMAWPLTLRKTLAASAAMGAVFLTAIVNPQAWWARYAPQLWIVPVVAAILSVHVNTRPLRILGGILILVLAANSVLVGTSYLKSNRKATREVRAQLSSLSSAGNPMVAHFGMFRSGRARLRQAGIRYREVTDPNDLPGPVVPNLVLSTTTVYEDK